MLSSLNESFRLYFLKKSLYFTIFMFHSSRFSKDMSVKSGKRDLIWNAIQFISACALFHLQSDVSIMYAIILYKQSIS